MDSQVNKIPKPIPDMFLEQISADRAKICGVIKEERHKRVTGTSRSGNVTNGIAAKAIILNNKADAINFFLSPLLSERAPKTGLKGIVITIVRLDRRKAKLYGTDFSTKKAPAHVM